MLQPTRTLGASPNDPMSIRQSRKRHEAEVTEGGSWADVATLNVKNGATQAGSSTDPASHRSPLRSIRAHAASGKQDPEKQEEHDFEVKQSQKRKR